MIETITIDTEQWAVVPIEPTPKMAKDGAVAAMLHWESDAIECYAAMLDAAPRPEDGQPAENTSEAIGYISQQGLDWLKSDGYRAATLRSQPSSDNTIPLYTEQQPSPRPVPADKLEYLCDLVTSRMLDAAAANNHSITLALEPVRDGLSALLADLLVVPPSDPRPVPTSENDASE